MDWAMWGILIALFLLLFLFINLFSRRQSKQKDLKIKDLTRSLSLFEQKFESLERRNSFRLKLPTKPTCKFEIVDVGDKALDKILNKEVNGNIEDISRTGLKLIADIDVPVRKRIIINLNFNILSEPFSLRGAMVHKREEINGRIYYGIKFIDISAKVQGQLAFTLQKLEVLSKKSESSKAKSL